MAQATEPPNSPSEVHFSVEKGTFEIRYEGKGIFAGKLGVKGLPGLNRQIKVAVNSSVGARGEVTEVISLEAPTGSSLELIGKLSGSSESFPAETYTQAQDKFKLVRNAVGLSHNLRNNAIYDRQRDWMLESTSGANTHIRPESHDAKKNQFNWKSTGSKIILTFRPRFYQKHKNLTYFKPWEYSVWKESITGWCSWWAYFADVTEKDVDKVGTVFADKLKDFGYKTIQIDDGYQSSGGGLPKDWLTTNDRFPSGLQHLSDSIRSKGLEPALWVNVHFDDETFVKAHPDWFIQDKQGNPFKGPWIDYGLDGSNPTALENVVRPVYKALHKMGWRYVKVDTLRHLLYDSSYPNKAFFEKKGIKLEDAFRGYLRAIRSEIGPQTYMLACWGVLPEVIGIANGCRLGGDGFGPSTLQQYTSWNNVVWRNDPDHCDIKPLDRKTGATIDGEERIRPVLVSMAGAQLLLSDKPEVYENDANLEGVKRSSPILFTLPGQLYDYDPVKTDHLKSGLRNDHGGAQAGPIDADQKGTICPWWMLEVYQPFESWNVLTHLNWSEGPVGQSEVNFSDLGLPASKYSVFEFWSKKYLGDFETSFTAHSLAPKDVTTYSIRKTLAHPQILSTSRHISQGAVDLVNVKWDGNTLSGESKVVKKDPYSLYIRIPVGYNLKSAHLSGGQCDVRIAENMAEIRFIPETTGTIRWTVTF